MSLGKVIGALFLALFVLTTSVSAASEVQFAVVREAATENDPQWLGIKETLGTISYRVVPLAQLNRTTLEGVKVLFLPNVLFFNPSTVESLALWTSQGGRLIVSGPIGQKSDPEVQLVLQQIIAAAWTGQLDSPTYLKVESTAQPWNRALNQTPVEEAGILNPNGLAVVARWQNPEQQPAVLSNAQITYLGWTWADRNSRTFDRSWLGAALDQYLPGFSKSRAIKIEPVEIFSMRQELANLLGRVENIAASADPQALTPNYTAAIAQARSALDDLPKLIQAGNDDQARILWEGAVEALWLNYPIVQTIAPPEVRAIWLDRGTIVEAGSPEGLRKVFDRLAGSGINTVFFETINAGYPIYPSRVATEQNPLTRSWDPLLAAVTLAHERKMELHAWCWIFAVGNSRHNRILNLPDSYPGPVLSRNPQWAMTNDQGSSRPRGQTEYWIDPANREARNYLLRLVDEIVTGYNVDGVQLDYIRYPFQGLNDFGYSASSRSYFKELHGVDPITLDNKRDLSLFKLWNQFKARQVSEFVAEVSSQIQRTRPRVLLSGAVYPFERRERMLKIQQDWDTWASAGQIDMLVPMTYTLNTRRLQQQVAPILTRVEEAPVLFLPSLNLQELPQVQLRDQLQVVRDLPSDGYSLFAAAHLSDDLYQVLQQAPTTSQVIPYREPLRTVQERFDLLKNEWENLRKKDKLSIPANQVAEWQSQSNRLQSLFQDLTQKPSVIKIRQARTEITTYRGRLKNWLRQERFDQSYRSQSWDYRLAAMDGLLRYADQVFNRIVRK